MGDVCPSRAQPRVPCAGWYVKGRRCFYVHLNAQIIEEVPNGEEGNDQISAREAEGEDEEEDQGAIAAESGG